MQLHILKKNKRLVIQKRNIQPLNWTPLPPQKKKKQIHLLKLPPPYRKKHNKHIKNFF